MMTEEEWSDHRNTFCRIEEGDLVQLSSYGLRLSRMPNLTIFAGEMGVVVEGNISRHSNSFATVAVQWIKPNRNKIDHVSFRKLKLIIRKKKQPIRINKSEMVRRRKREERKAHWRGVYLARRKRIWRCWVGGILFILLSLLILSSL